MKKILIFVLCILLIKSTAYAGLFDTTDYEPIVMNSWMGENINAIIEKLGYPDKSIEINSKKVYTWESQNLKCELHDTSYDYKKELSCDNNLKKRQIEFDSNNIAIKWRSNYTIIGDKHYAMKLVNPNKNTLK